MAPAAPRKDAQGEGRQSCSAGLPLQGEAALRAIAGVRSATTSSLALGGVSVMQVSYEGSYEMLRAGLQARGYSVSANGTTLRISRRGVGATP